MPGQLHLPYRSEEGARANLVRAIDERDALCTCQCVPRERAVARLETGAHPVFGERPVEHAGLETLLMLFTDEPEARREHLDRKLVVSHVVEGEAIEDGARLHDSVDIVGARARRHE